MSLSSIVLVTGASSGIGHSICKHLLEKGHRVAGLARRSERLEALKGEFPDSFLAIQGDVERVEDILAAKQQIHSQWGAITVLVNNAGVGHLGEMDQTPLEEWHHMMDVNVKGLLTCTHTFLSDLEASRGLLVNIDSVAGHEVYPGAVVYCASKWAVKAISAGMEKEFKGRIRVCNISPGAVETEFVQHTSIEERRQQMEERFKNVLVADDIAKAVGYALDQREGVAINEITIRPFKA